MSDAVARPVASAGARGLSAQHGPPIHCTSPPGVEPVLFFLGSCYELAYIASRTRTS
ncbi:MAG: hypothetical protein KatS3mg057_2803 [Herpetosiphonaceae bacterium]|nr:MAG: hypothetical protein KatS3mg057_2803 [Herpetosiphonaceae bacterium]